MIEFGNFKNKFMVIFKQIILNRFIILDVFRWDILEK
jgi:hypothetical protein